MFYHLTTTNTVVSSTFRLLNYDALSDDPNTMIEEWAKLEAFEEEQGMIDLVAINFESEAEALNNQPSIN